MKNYAVVKFIEADNYSEVPLNWLLHDDRFEDKTAYRWPGPRVKNIVQKVKNRITPPENWPVYAVKILRYCDTFESARKAAENSQYSSAPETFGRGHRRRKVSSPVRNVLNSKQKKIYSSSSDEDSDESSKAPRLPVLQNLSQNSGSGSISKKIRRKESESDSSRTHDEEDDLDVLVTETLSRGDANINGNDPKKGQSETTASEIRAVCDGTDAQNNRKLKILEDKLDYCLHLLGKLLTEVKDLKQRSVSNNNGNSDPAISAEVETYLKLNSRDGVTAFEAQLESSTEFENEFIRKVKQLGGANGKDYTERALAFTFSDKFAKDNTWEGKITKYKVNTLKVIQICEKVVLEKFPTFDKAEFSKAGTNWFRLGNQRAGD